MDPSIEHSTPLPEKRKLTPELKELLVPSQTAIIVVDVQGAYCDPGEVPARLAGAEPRPEIPQRVSPLRRRPRDP